MRLENQWINYHNCWVCVSDCCNEPGQTSSKQAGNWEMICLIHNLINIHQSSCLNLSIVGQSLNGSIVKINPSTSWQIKNQQKFSNQWFHFIWDWLMNKMMYEQRWIELNTAGAGDIVKTTNTVFRKHKSLILFCMVDWKF